MGPADILASLRAWLLGSAALVALVGQRVHVARADVAGAVPAVALELAGGGGQMNHAMGRVSVTINAWSQVSWAEALDVLHEASARLRNATHVDGLTAPVLSVASVGAPSQVSDAMYYHATVSITCIVREV